MSRHRDPTHLRDREGDLDKPRVRRGVAKLRHGKGLRRSVAMLHRGVALFIDMCFFSCFDIPLFRGLVYWTNEDPIRVRKGPFMFVR